MERKHELFVVFDFFMIGLPIENTAKIYHISIFLLCLITLFFYNLHYLLLFLPKGIIQFRKNEEIIRSMTCMYVYMYCFLFSDEHVKSIMTTVKVYKKSNNI